MAMVLLQIQMMNGLHYRLFESIYWDLPWCREALPESKNSSIVLQNLTLQNYSLLAYSIRARHHLKVAEKAEGWAHRRNDLT